jgi:protoheme IX farnesyltransferase
MKQATFSPPVSLAVPRTRFADYLELTKPRIAVLVLFTVAAGAMLAAGGRVHLPVLLHALVGTGLVAAGASALNQLLERNTDARMRRTENRPLPAGRLHPLEVLAFGCGLGFVGVAYLVVSLQRPWAALVAAVTFVSYVCIYTPLKRRTPLNTLVGAVPGALPPLIGWTAVRGTIDPEALTLFFIIFLWQVPHFLAIAWIYREDYARARLRMLPVLDADGTRTARQMLTCSLALLPASLAPVLFGGAGLVYLGGAILLGAFFLWRAVGFTRDHSVARARRVLRGSLVYLPALFALLVLDGATNSLWK